MKFMLGVNYWDSRSGTDMWRQFDPEVIRADVRSLADCGVRQMRVFPNWRDFQPVEEYLGWHGVSRGFCDYSERPLANEDGIDETMIAHFREFAGICAESGIGLIVSVLTGWMSGRLFIPRALIGKNLLTDPAALMWTHRYLRGFVTRVRDLPNIIMWDLGNECNCMGQSGSDAQSYVWTAFVRDAIHAADPTREISSGMHGLSSDGGAWTIRTQGELTDYLTPHPYVSKTIHNDVDPMNTGRTAIYPTAQCVFYESIGGKPTILQEQGTFTEALGNAEMAADFVRVNILSAFIHGVRGYFWWCGMNHSGLVNAPYCWSMIERELGLVDSERRPKPVAHALREAGETIEALPFDEMPARLTDAVCLLTAEQNHWDCAAPAFVLGKQAGIDMTFATCRTPLPGAELYIVPCLTGWSVMDQGTQEALFRKVRAGATAYLSYNGGQFSRFEEFTGLRSDGIVTSRRSHRADTVYGEYTYYANQEILAEPTEAEVVLQNEEGNVLLSRHRYGKGTVWFLNAPLEQQLAGSYGAFSNPVHAGIYRTVFAEALAKKPVTSDNFAVAVSLHRGGIVTALNYTDREQECAFRVAPGKRLVPLSGSAKRLPKCSAAFYRLENQA